VHVSALAGISKANLLKPASIKKYAGQVQQQALAAGRKQRDSDITVTNNTSIPLKVWITDSAEAYASADVGKVLSTLGVFTDLQVGECDLFARPNENTDTYALFLSPNIHPLVLGKWHFAPPLPGLRESCGRRAWGDGGGQKRGFG